MLHAPPRNRLQLPTPRTTAKPPDVLIISKRNVPRLADLNAAEVSDLFTCVQRVGSVIERVFKAEALNIALQVSEGKA
jgi:bis(5'-adenosyl)-triphosphatase